MKEPATHKVFGVEPVSGVKGRAVPAKEGEAPTCRKCLAWVRAANRSYRTPRTLKAPRRSRWR
jgi:hypothetical protein